MEQSNGSLFYACFVHYGSLLVNTLFGNHTKALAIAEQSPLGVLAGIFAAAIKTLRIG